MGSARSRAAGGGWVAAVLLAVLLGPAVPARAQYVETTIDLSYLYEQNHLGSNVLASTNFIQKYQVKLSTNLTSSLDFLGAVTLDLDDKWDLDAANTSKVAPSLELGVAGPQSAAKYTYTATINKTRPFEEAGESTQYSNDASLDLEVTPDYWPELKFKIQEKRDYELQTTEATDRIVELQARDEFLDVRVDFLLRYDTKVDKLPQSGVSDSVDWSWKMTYKESVLSDVDFEVAYEIKESNIENTVRGAFSTLDDEYTQTLRWRLKKSLELTPRLTSGVSWDYQYDQDLLKLDFDNKVQNKFALDVRYDMFPGMKVSGEAKRETSHEEAEPGQDDIGKLTDTIKGAFDFEPMTWLRLGGKVELKWDDAIAEDTGGSVDATDEKQYELTLRNKFSDYWDLAASTNSSWSYVDGALDERESKAKVAVKLRLLKLTWSEVNIVPSYEATKKTTWDELGFFEKETSTGDAKFKFEIKALLLRNFRTTFFHEYARKTTRENDAVLDFKETVGYNEDTRLNVALVDVFEGFNLEGEIERKADDTEGDEEEQVVVVSYALKLDWRYEEFSLSSAFKYNDRSSQEDDDVEFTAKAGWKGERIDIYGDYQYNKTYSTLTDEDRKLNLKLSLKF